MKNDGYLTFPSNHAQVLEYAPVGDRFSTDFRLTALVNP